MLGKVIVAGAGAGAAAAAAYLLRSGGVSEQYARLRARAHRLPGLRTPGTVPVLVDHRPQALENRTAAPVLLPDATPVEIARAVAQEQPRSS